MSQDKQLSLYIQRFVKTRAQQITLATLNQPCLVFLFTGYNTLQAVYDVSSTDVEVSTEYLNGGFITVVFVSRMRPGFTSDYSYQGPVEDDFRIACVMALWRYHFEFELSNLEKKLAEKKVRA